MQGYNFIMPDQKAISFMNYHPYCHPEYRQFPYCYSPFFPDFHCNKLLKTQDQDPVHRNLSQYQPECTPQINYTQQRNVEIQKCQPEIQNDLIVPECTNQFSKKTGRRISSRKAKYFDPNNAPMITSFRKYEVVDKELQINKPDDWQAQWLAHENKSVLDQEDEQSFPFIIFKDRKCRKKYRRIMKNRKIEDSSYYYLSASEEEPMSENN